MLLIVSTFIDKHVWFLFSLTFAAMRFFGACTQPYTMFCPLVPHIGVFTLFSLTAPVKSALVTLNTASPSARDWYNRASSLVQLGMSRFMEQNLFRNEMFFFLPDFMTQTDWIYLQHLRRFLRIDFVGTKLCRGKQGQLRYELRAIEMHTRPTLVSWIWAGAWMQFLQKQFQSPYVICLQKWTDSPIQ